MTLSSSSPRADVLSVPSKAAILSFGVKCPIGNTLEEAWNSALGSVTASERLNVDYTDCLRSFVVAKTLFPVENYFSETELRRMDRLHVLGLAAAIDAAESCPKPLTGPRVAVVAGVGLPSPGLIEEQIGLSLTKPRLVNPLTIPLTMTNGLASMVARRIGATGPCQTLSTACCSGSDALGFGMMLLRTGTVDRVLVVGADAPLTPGVLHSFARSLALSSRHDDSMHASQPFGKDREGFVIAEGGAAAVIELGQTLEPSAYGGFLGYGASNDAFHLTAPEPQGRGAKIAVEAALLNAAITSDEIKSVNAHGTSTRLNDELESQVITEYFGADTPVTSLKGSTGHMIGGSGLLEALFSARSAVTGLVPPTAGTVEVDENIQARIVTRESVNTGSGSVISHSFGFGGQNSAIIACP